MRSEYEENITEPKILARVVKHCPVCNYTFRLSPFKALIGTCPECKTDHYFNTKKILPLKSIPHSLKPKKCNCPSCSTK
jgi:hypothetical protein